MWKWGTAEALAWHCKLMEQRGQKEGCDTFGITGTGQSLRQAHLQAIRTCKTTTTHHGQPLLESKASKDPQSP